MRSVASRLALTVGLCLAVCAPAWGHAALRRSEPKLGATLSKAPAQVSLWFSEELQPGLSRVEVKQGGKVVSSGRGTLDPKDHKHMTVPVKGAKGAYQVHWKALARDGHPSSGTFTFSVK